MSITSFGGPLWIPNPPILGTGGAAGFATAITINASGDRMGWVFQCPKSGTLDWFEFLLTTFTQATNGLRVSFQTVDPTNGNPDGTQDQFRDITSGLASGNWMTPPGVMTHDGTNGGVKRTVTAGEWIACVIDFVSWAASDSVGITPGWNLVVADNLLAYVANASTGTYAKNDGCGIFALKYADGTYAQFPLFASVPAKTTTTTTFNSGSTPDERGLRFTIPIAARMLGGWVRLDADAACDIVLYDSGGAVVAGPLAIDSDIRQQTTGQNAPFIWPAPVDLAASSVYRLVVKPGASNISLYQVTVESNARLGAFPLGTSAHLTTRTDAGAFSDTDTAYPLMGLLLNGFDTTGGVGGGVSRSRVQRGM